MTATQLLRRVRQAISPRTTAALVVGALSAMLFLFIAGEVLEGKASAPDRALSLWLHRYQSAGLTSFMRLLSALGTGYAVIAALLLSTLVGLRRRAYPHVAILLGVSSLAGVSNALMKLLFRRPRPQLGWGAPLPSSYSFPSGHAMGSAAAYGIMAFVLASLYPGLRWPLAVTTPLLILLIGLSRVYLGVHWPSDVLAGFAAGCCVLTAGVWAVKSPKRADRD